jgi:hypothetical protein
MMQASSAAPAHEIRRGHRFSSIFRLLARNENNPGGECCPVCDQPAAVVPAASEYRGKGIVHHHGQCRSCGHAWITVLHVCA